MRFALLTTGLVATINSLTADKIAEQEQLQLTNQLQEVLPHSKYTNELSQDCVIISDPLLGPYDNQVIYRARKDDEPVALVIRHVTPSGYSGDINLLSAVARWQRCWCGLLSMKKPQVWAIKLKLKVRLDHLI